MVFGESLPDVGLIDADACLPDVGLNDAGACLLGGDVGLNDAGACLPDAGLIDADACLPDAGLIDAGACLPDAGLINAGTCLLGGDGSLLGRFIPLTLFLASTLPCKSPILRSIVPRHIGQLSPIVFIIFAHGVHILLLISEHPVQLSLSNFSTCSEHISHSPAPPFLLFVCILFEPRKVLSIVIVLLLSTIFVQFF